MNFLIKINRFSAWVLLLGIILYFASGFGMTKGLVDSSLALKIHLNILPYIVLAAFVFHAGFGIRMAFLRWRIWNLAGKILLFFILAGFVGFFVWAEFFYTSGQQEVLDDAAPALPVTLNMGEISKHNTIEDCWLVINNNAYNVTDYISLHPGGVDNIMANCGKDATQAFNTKYSEQESHSEYAVNTLNQYFIGNIGQIIYLK